MPMTPFKKASEESVLAFRTYTDLFVGPNVREANHQELHAIQTPAVWVSRSRFLAHIQKPGDPAPPPHIRVVSVTTKGLYASIGGQVVRLRVSGGALWA